MEAGTSEVGEHDRVNIKRRALKRLEQTGFQVQLMSASLAA